MKAFISWLALAVAILPGGLSGQLNTGVLEGTLRAPNGHFLPDTVIVITGGTGLQTVIHSNAIGEFAIALPYGQYRLPAGRGGRRSGFARSPANKPARSGGHCFGNLDRYSQGPPVSGRVQLVRTVDEPGAVERGGPTRFHGAERQPAGGRIAAGIF